MLGFVNPWVILAALLAAGGSYAWGRHDGGRLEAAKHDAEYVLIAKTTEAAQRGAAGEIAKLTIQHVTIQQKVERTIREIPVYRDCQHPDGVVRDVNAALGNRPVAPGN